MRIFSRWKEIPSEEYCDAKWRHELFVQKLLAVVRMPIRPFSGSNSSIASKNFQTLNLYTKAAHVTSYIKFNANISVYFPNRICFNNYLTESWTYNGRTLSCHRCWKHLPSLREARWKFYDVVQTDKVADRQKHRRVKQNLVENSYLWGLL